MAIDIENHRASIHRRLEVFKTALNELELELTDQLNIDSQEFRTAEQISKVLTKITNHQTPVIYRLAVEDQLKKKALIQSFKLFKIENRKETKATGQLNLSRFNDTNSSTLYLGSKMKSPRTRINQHLGNGYFRTYSLHLNKWDINVQYSLQLNIYKLKTNIPEQYKRNFVELVEQELWEKYQPIFGKKSGV